MTSGYQSAARHIPYYEYDSGSGVTCPRCSWTGRADQHENVVGFELIEVSCAECKAIILIVPFPTMAETKQAAAAGNEAATSDLVVFQKAQAKEDWRKVHPHLTSTTQLPDIDQDRVVIEWDLITLDEHPWQLLRHGDTIIWKEPGYYESLDRFEQIFEILRSRYGPRLAAVNPTPDSELWLFGDRLSPGTPARLNASLHSPTSTPAAAQPAAGAATPVLMEFDFSSRWDFWIEQLSGLLDRTTDTTRHVFCFSSEHDEALYLQMLIDGRETEVEVSGHSVETGDAEAMLCDLGFHAPHTQRQGRSTSPNWSLTLTDVSNPDVFELTMKIGRDIIGLRDDSQVRGQAFPV